MPLRTIIAEDRNHPFCHKHSAHTVRAGGEHHPLRQQSGEVEVVAPQCACSAVFPSVRNAYRAPCITGVHHQRRGRVLEKLLQTLSWKLLKGHCTKQPTFSRLYVSVNSKTYTSITHAVYLPPQLSAAPEEMNLTWKRGRASEKEKGRVGRESLVKWNLVTDATEGGAALQGWVEVGCCVYVRAHVFDARARHSHLCARARAGWGGRGGQDMSAHWESGSFTRRDHFTLPFEAFFPPKAFSCSWLSNCRECNRERKGRIISTYNRPKSTVGRKGGGGEGEGEIESEREENSVREWGRREWGGEGDTGKVFVLFLFFLPSSPPPVLTGEHGPGAQESCTAAGESR